MCSCSHFHVLNPCNFPNCILHLELVYYVSMPESTSKPDLDTRLRDALIPVLDLEEDEMLDAIIVIYTAVHSEGTGLHFITSSNMTPWGVKGMIACFLEMLPVHPTMDEDND